MGRTRIGTDKLAKTEVRDGFRVDWDVPIKMDDGLVLRANVYRPNKRELYTSLPKPYQGLNSDIFQIDTNRSIPQHIPSSPK